MIPVIDHVGFRVADFDVSVKFYREVLATLGVEQLADMTFGRDRIAGFGRDGHSVFWLNNGRAGRTETHVAFAAASRAEVHAFYSVALSMGGRDNGAPGLRPHYHAAYYGAFVLDPDGHNVEAVCHSSE